MRSIRRTLLAWLMGALAIGTIVMLLASYALVLEELNEVLDENLKQVAMAVSTHRSEADARASHARSPVARRVTRYVTVRICRQ